MKVFLSLALCVAVAFAEPPLYRQQQNQQGQRYFFARQQQQQQQQESVAASGPYEPSGWKPEGPAFNLPQRQPKQQPDPSQVENVYGPPKQQYGPPQQPQQQYGPPQQPQQQYGPPQSPQGQYGPPQAQGPSPRQQAAPAFRPQQFGRQQQQQPQQQYGAPEPQGQYGAPAKQQQQQQPQQQYGAPEPQGQYGAPAKQQYGPPASQYGAPEQSTTDYPSVTEIDEPTTDAGFAESESEQIGSANELEEDGELDGQPRPEQQQRQQAQKQERGEYYVALPDGRLQRVRYVSRQDIEAMRYFAKIRAENVEPLRGPIYAYAPLQKLEVAPGNLRVAVAPLVPSTLSVTAEERKPQKLVAPKVDIKPLAQVQVQHDNPASVLPLSSSYTTFTANYQVPAAPLEDRYILAFP